MSRKLLLADASTAIQRVVALTFSSEDVQVVAVSDGEQAIQRIPVERPDIVLASIGTAKRSGYDVAAFVRAHPDLSHVPVLLLASAFEPVDEERARQVKSAGVLVKPFDPQQVIARVRDLVPGNPLPSPGAAGVVAEAVAPSPASAELPAGGPVASAVGLDLGVSNSDTRLAHPQPVIPSLESRTPNPGAPVSTLESRVPDPPSPAPNATPVRTGSLDDYFDRLNAALTSRSASRPAPPAPVQSGASDDDATDVKVPSIDDVLGPDPQLSGAHAALADSGPAVAPGEGRTGADAAPVPIAITDELVDRIAQRVVDRMSGDTAKQLLAGLVERLVREELAGGQLE